MRRSALLDSPVGAISVGEPLTGGGMGELFNVRLGDPSLAHHAVLKTVRPGVVRRSDHHLRLWNEGNVLGALCHPKIPKLITRGVLNDGRPFFVMQRMEGETLRRRLMRAGFFTPSEVVLLGKALLEVLDYVHRAGFVHRDVKPDNLLVDRRGGLSLIDFGLALSIETPLRQTHEGCAIGTPRSMAPEQFEGPRKELDQRADIYNVGLLLYELLSGVGPFDGGDSSMRAMKLAHAEWPPMPVGAIAPQPVPEALSAVVMKALAKRPQSRFTTALAMRRALDGCALHCEPTELEPTQPDRFDREPFEPSTTELGLQSSLEFSLDALGFAETLPTWGASLDGRMSAKRV